ncbi:MAG: D-alanyl-D-alanine carboxypeptidase, partial [Clostridia bacterium]|nr:D-alanyl-D-alanine carboxypeptidase [Clostridia bacterium]
MKRIWSILLVIVICSSCFCVRAQMAVSAQSCILVEALTGHVLYEKDADAVMPMASTTKLFTALMIRECCQLDEMVTISDSAAKVEGSSSNLQAGERISVEQLLYALLLSSGNDAAEALAEHAFD